MTQLFLNYRVDDDPFGVLYLDAELSKRFGSDAVFLASKSIPPGEHWKPAMFQAVADSVALLAIIGRNWLSAKSKGRRRIDDPDDFVRRELLAAFELGKPVIPVRLGMRRLSRTDLPPALAELAERQDVEIRFRSGRIDVDRLATELAKLVPELPPPEPAPSCPAPTASTSGMSYGANNVALSNIHVGGDFTGRDQINHAPRRRHR